jgi:hypothetical protein
MSSYKLKIQAETAGTKVISILRKFDPSLSIGEIRRRIQENDYAVEYDLLRWEVTEELAGVDRISRFEGLIRALEECGAGVAIYNGDRLEDKEMFGNSMQMLREIRCEVEEDMEREAEEDDHEEKNPKR